MSTAVPADVIARIRAVYDQCFACGQGNPLGMHLDGFERHEASVRAPFRPRPEYGGFEGVLHGAIVATALDEILAWSAMLLEGVMVLTGTLDLSFRAPAPVDAEYMLQGLAEDRRGRRLKLTGSMQLDGKVIAEAGGIYLAKETLTAATASIV